MPTVQKIRNAMLLNEAKTALGLLDTDYRDSIIEDMVDAGTDFGGEGKISKEETEEVLDAIFDASEKVQEVFEVTE